MGWQFRKSKSFGPFRLSFTRRGVSLSAGSPLARISVSNRGEVRETTRIPGTGIYKTTKVASPSSSTPMPNSAAAKPGDMPPPHAPAGWYADPDGSLWTQNTVNLAAGGLVTFSGTWRCA